MATLARKDEKTDSIVQLFPSITPAKVHRRDSWEKECTSLKDLFNEHKKVLNRFINGKCDVENSNNESLHTFLCAVLSGDIDVVNSLIQKGSSPVNNCVNGITPTVAAVLFQQKEAFHTLVRRGADIHQIDKDGNNLLMICAYEGAITMVTKLLELNIDVNLQNKYGRTALMMAAYKGHMLIVKLLCQKSANVDIQSNTGMTAIMYACITSQHEIIAFLLNNSNVYLEDNDGNTCMGIVSSTGDIKAIELIINSKDVVNCSNKYGKTPLMCAAEAGRSSVVEYLLNKGASVNTCMNNGKCALDLAFTNGHHNVAAILKGEETSEKDNVDNVKGIIMASLQGDIKAVQEAIEQNTNVNTTDYIGRTPLMAACQGGHLQIVKYLVQHRAQVNQRNYSGMTALAYTVQCKHEKLSDFLLQHTADLESQDENKQTIIMHATNHNNIEQVKYLCLLGSNIFHKDKDGKTTLMKAAELGFLDIFQYLVSQGCRILTTCSSGLSANDYAFINDRSNVVTWLQNKESQSNIDLDVALIKEARRGNTAKVEQLLEAGASVQCSDGGDTPLIIAATEANIEIVKILISHNACVNYRNPFNGRTALFRAISRKNVLVIKYLVENGASVNISDSKGTTLLMLTAVSKSVKTTNFLLRHGARCQAVNPNYVTAISCACFSGSVEIASMFIQNGASVNLADIHGNTPLHTASYNGHSDLVTLLVENKANINAMNINGLTALDTAIHENHHSIIRYLQECGAVSKDKKRKIDSKIHQLLTESNGKIIQIEDIVRFAVLQEEKEKEQNITAIEKDFLEMCLGSFNEESGEKFLQKGVSVDVKDKNGVPILCLAVKEKQLQTVEWLIKNRTNVNCQDPQGVTPLMYACQTDEITVVKLLMDKIENLEITDETGQTALAHAVRCSKFGTVKLLLSKAAIVDTKDANGTTPLMIAASKHNYDIIKLLVKFNASINIKDNHGQTTLCHCVQFTSDNCAHIIDFLVHSGADTEITSETPLLTCIEFNNLEGVNALLSLRKDMNLFSNYPANVWMLCADKQSYSILSVLLKTSMVDDLLKIPTFVLLYLLCNNYFTALDMLLHHKQNLSNCDGDSFLISAFAQQNIQFIEYIVQSGLVCWKTLLTFTDKHFKCGNGIISSNIEMISVRNNHKMLFMLTSNLGLYEWMALIISSCKDGERDISKGSYQCFVIDDDDDDMFDQFDVLEDEDTTHVQDDDTDSNSSIYMDSDITSDNSDTYEHNDFKNPVSKPDVQTMREESTKLEDRQIKKKLIENMSLMKDITDAFARRLNEAHVLDEYNAGLVRTLETIEKLENGYLDQLEMLERILQLKDKEMEYANEIRNNLKRKITMKEKWQDYNYGSIPDVYKEIKLAETPSNKPAETPSDSKVSDNNQVISNDIAQEEISGEVGDANINSKTTSIKRHCYRCSKCNKCHKCGVPLQPKKNNRFVKILSPGPESNIFLYQCHYTVSQCTLDGRQTPSNSCALIAVLFAHKYLVNPTEMLIPPTGNRLPGLLFEQVEDAIREGNYIHHINYEGKPFDLGPEEVLLLTNDLGTKLVRQTDVDTRVQSTLIKDVIELNPNQALLFIKNQKVVSIISCNNNQWLLLFDSHVHYMQISKESRHQYGSYLFLAKKDEATVEQLFQSYEYFCDPYPFYGKFAIFEFEQESSEN